MKCSNRGSRLIFIGGAARSGTTLIHNMLDCHPEIFGGPEFLHLNDMMELKNNMHLSVDRGWIDLICSHDKLDSEFGNFIENFFLPLADKNNSKFYSEKTPENVLVFQDLMKIFPDAHFINIVRDPRATIASLFQVGKRAKKEGWTTQDFTYSLVAAIDYVEKCLDAGFCASKIAPEKVLTITYEQLVTRPEEISKKICNFLDIDWSNKMLFPREKKHSGEKALSNKVWYTSEMFNRNPDASQIEKWKKILSPSQIIYISTHFADNKELSRLGYDFSVNEFPALTCFYTNIYRKSFFLTSIIGQKIYSITLGNPKMAGLKRVIRKVV